jgi:hypothetical protein
MELTALNLYAYIEKIKFSDFKFYYFQLSGH